MKYTLIIKMEETKTRTQNQYTNLSEDERKELLMKAFEKEKIEHRDDSRLCNIFIENAYLTKYNTPELIARRMAEMHYLYWYTQYPALLINCRKRYEKKLEEGKVYYIKPNVEAEYIALKGEDFPEVFPWIKEN